MNRTGRRSALYTSACGSAVLAAMPAAARETELAPFLPLEEVMKFAIELRKVFRFGYLVTDIGQHGFTSVATPIIDDRIGSRSYTYCRSDSNHEFQRSEESPSSRSSNVPLSRLDRRAFLYAHIPPEV